MIKSTACTLLLLVTVFVQDSKALLCYRCNSNQPGCGTSFNPFLYNLWGETCEPRDVCVKIIERKEAETIITRECLSSVEGIRTDIPADKYEGCRPAARDERLGHYVNNSINQLDIHRDFYDEVTWCFCYFHDRCNSSTRITISYFIILGMTVLILFF